MKQDKRLRPSNVMWLTFAIVLLALFYDIYAIRAKKITFSRQVSESSKKYAMIPFLFGVLAGHFFWNLQEKKK